MKLTGMLIEKLGYFTPKSRHGSRINTDGFPEQAPRHKLLFFGF